MKTHASERGQTLVLILLAIVGLMGFAALAVDGGHVFSERRRAQTATDAAALAAARKGASKGTEADIRSAGATLAETNGFTHGGRTTVQINHPPVSPSPYAGNASYYQAIITTEIDPIFAQFVFAGPQIITTEAVVMASDVTPASGGNAIFAVDSTEGNRGIEFKGTVGVYVDGGNIFSNSDAGKNGASGKIETINGGKIFTHGSFGFSGAQCGPGKTVDPCPTTGVAPQSPPDVPEPYCPPEGSAPTTIDSVKYFTWSGNPSSPMQPGIHCLYGGITLHGNGKITGNNVLLVLKSGGITLNGNSELSLTRASDIKDKNGNQYGGMLLYVPKSNVDDKGDPPIITLGGTNDSRINGTVYAPTATCDLGGTSQANAFHTAFICNTFKFHGTTDLRIVYKDVENFQFAPSISVTQ